MDISDLMSVAEQDKKSGHGVETIDIPEVVSGTSKSEQVGKDMFAEIREKNSGKVEYDIKRDGNEVTSEKVEPQVDTTYMDLMEAASKDAEVSSEDEVPEVEGTGIEPKPIEEITVTGDEDELPENATKKTQNVFKKYKSLKSEFESTKEQRDSLREEIEELRAKVEKYEPYVNLHAGVNSPEYKSRFVDYRSQVVEDTIKAGRKWGMSEELVKKMFAGNDIIDAMDTFRSHKAYDYARDEINGFINNYYDNLSEEQSFVNDKDNIAANLKKLQSDEFERVQADRKAKVEHYNKLQEAVTQDLKFTFDDKVSFKKTWGALASPEFEEFLSGNYKKAAQKDVVDSFNNYYSELVAPGLEPNKEMAYVMAKRQGDIVIGKFLESKVVPGLLQQVKTLRKELKQYEKGKNVRIQPAKASDLPKQKRSEDSEKAEMLKEIMFGS